MNHVLATAATSRRPWPGAACLILVALGTLANLLWPRPALVWGVGAAAGLFLLLEHRRIPASIRRVTLAVGATSLLLQPLVADPLAALAKGIAIGGTMVSLISSVSLLARASLDSPQTRVVAQHLLASRMRSRYAWFSLASQLFGGLLGMAGVNLLLQMAARDERAPKEDRLAMFSAITRGFSAATLWSPMVSNLTILVALYPGLSWFSIAPLTFSLAVGAVLIGTGLDWWRLRGRGEPAPPAPPDRPLPAALAALLASMACFLVTVMLVARTLHIAVVGAIVMVIPAAVLAVHWAQAKGARRLAQGLGFLKTDVLATPALAGEVALFMAAGCGGTVIAGAIPPAWTAMVGGALAQAPVLACLTLMLIIIALAFLAVHPVLSTVLVASSLPPAVVHLAPLPHLAAILVGWALATCAAPFSMLALMASRYSGFSIYTVTTRTNRAFTLLCLGIAALALGLASAKALPSF